MSPTRFFPLPPPTPLPHTAPPSIHFDSVLLLEDHLQLRKPHYRTTGFRAYPHNDSGSSAERAYFVPALTIFLQALAELSTTKNMVFLKHRRVTKSSG